MQKIQQTGYYKSTRSGVSGLVHYDDKAKYCLNSSCLTSEIRKLVLGSSTFLKLRKIGNLINRKVKTTF